MRGHASSTMHPLIRRPGRMAPIIRLGGHRIAADRCLAGARCILVVDLPYVAAHRTTGP